MYATGRLEIRVIGSEQPGIQIDCPGTEGCIIGRTDSSSSYVPDIDLVDYGARDRGVSRRHAVLVRYRGMVHVVDLNSVNGTFLNGERLLPDVPYPLKMGDQLSLGNLNVSILYKS